MYKISIWQNNSKHNVFVYGKKTLLIELQERNIPMNYNCKSGHCGICIAKLIKGEVRHNNAIYPLVAKEILLCQAIAKSNIEIKIEF